MKINYLNGKELDSNTKTRLKKAFEIIINELGQPKTIEVNLALVTSDEIKEMNNKNRNTNKATDVLSFPAFNFKIGEVIDYNNRKFDLNINPETELFLLGDVVICKSIIKAQAEEYKHTESDEIVRLFVHSILHLFGYDHIEDKDYKIMNSVEEKILKHFNISAN